MIKDRQHQFRTLRSLIEAQVEELASERVPGIVVVLTKERRLDVFTTLGEHHTLDDDALRAMKWVLPQKLPDGTWLCHEVTDDQRDRFLTKGN